MKQLKSKRTGLFLPALIALGYLTGCGGSLYVIKPYVQIAEATVFHKDGTAAAGASIYQYGWPEGEAIHARKQEARLLAKDPRLFEGVCHEADRNGLVGIPLFASQTFHRSLWWMSPCKIDKDGLLGRECILAVDGDNGQELITAPMQPGANAQGKDYQIEIRSLSKPRPYK